MTPRVVQLPVGDDPPTARLFYGKPVLEALQGLPDSSVHVVCTSPPYWGLRDYGVPPQEWPEMVFSPMAGVPEMVVPAQTVAFGLEDDPMHYIAHMVLVYREVRRVLRGDGTAWLNLGDSFSRMTKKGRKYQGSSIDPAEKARARPTPPLIPKGLKPKDLMFIPHRAAMALQADGWWLRSDIVWAKGSCMPEPVKDRCTRNHESVFMLAKSLRYFYDSDAVKEPLLHPKHTGSRYGGDKQHVQHRPTASDHWSYSGRMYDATQLTGKNKRTVWNVNPRPYPGAHFAVWPPDLVEPMVRAGTSAHGVCGACGAPYKRVVERVVPDDPGRGEDSQGVQEADKMLGRSHDAHRRLGQAYQDQLEAHPPTTVGWEQTCKCEDGGLKRAVVMDIFSGSATTGMVALQEGRDYIGIDLQTDYLGLAEARLLGRKPPSEVEENEEGDIFDFFGGGDG